MLKIKELKKMYGTALAVSINSLDMEANGVVSIVGNNGAGKTTLLRILAGLVQPTQGSLLFYDEGRTPVEDSQKVVSAYLDESFLLDFLTAKEYLLFVLKINKISEASFYDEMANFGELISEEVLESNKRIKDLSTGNRTKLGIIAAFLSKKPIVVLDEPYANLDPRSQYVLSDYFKKVNAAQKKLLLVSSHNLEYIENFSFRLILIEKGELITDEHCNSAAVADVKHRLQTMVV